MKITQRVPRDQFAYIEFEKEYEAVEDAIAHNKELIANQNELGLDQKEWVTARNAMVATGEFDPNLELNKSQRFWVNQTKLALRSHKGEDPVIE